MKFKIISLGCPKNLVESEYLAGVLEKGGHNPLGRRMRSRHCQYLRFYQRCCPRIDRNNTSGSHKREHER